MLGGGGNWGLNFTGVRGARDVELGAFYFFCSKKILAGTELWTP